MYFLTTYTKEETKLNFFKDALSVTNIDYTSRDAIIDFLRKTDTWISKLMNDSE